MTITFTQLVGPSKGHCHTLDAEIISIGRAQDNTLRFEDGERRVSSRHARIRRDRDHYILQDLGSTNGTLINGRRIVVSELRHDDLVEFGAGGPLFRVGIPSDQPTVGLESNAGETGSKPASTEFALSRPKRHGNARFITGLAVAMLVGALGGTFLSSRLDLMGRDRTSFATVAGRNSPAVVFIRVEFQLVDAAGEVLRTDARTGSGFIISPDGLIVTNRHILRDWEYAPVSAGVTGRATRIEVILQGSRKEQTIPAQLYRLSDQTEVDVAILKIDQPRELRSVSALTQETPHVYQGDDIAVLGYPLGIDLLQLTNDEVLETSLFTGVVSRVSQDAIQLNLRAYHGNSGGPVLNRRGEIIGILTANVGSAQDIAFCIPIGAAIELIWGK